MRVEGGCLGTINGRNMIYQWCAIDWLGEYKILDWLVWEFHGTRCYLHVGV